MASIMAWLATLSVCLLPANVLRTVAVALVVGTVLFAINQLDVVLSGGATTSTWVKVGLTYTVPFCVANYSVVIARQSRPRSGRPGQK
ncbi:MAG: nitrate/nitrite transporter NrtS [Candidatus Dormibacteraceae bacterium]